MSRTAAPIPMFLSIDVEPDGFLLMRHQPAPWTGFAAVFSFAQHLRARLARRTGVSPRFGWYVRTDPQVAEVYGRGDYIFRERAELFAQLADAGDYFGVHAHALRWSDNHGAWVHDVGDDDWLAACTQSALDHFAEWDSGTPMRHRGGAAYLSNTTVEVLEANGVAADLTLEPTRAARSASVVSTAVDAATLVGDYPDYHGAPRAPYRPSLPDFRVPSANGDGRRLTLIPLTTYSPRRDGAWWKQAARRIKGSPRFEAPRVLYPSLSWPDPARFWDHAQRELAALPIPYVSIAIRTDAASSSMLAGVERVCMALVEHPLGDRVRLVDPLEII